MPFHEEDPSLRVLRLPHHPDYSRLSRMADTSYTCMVCGMDVNEGKPHFIVHPIRGGGELLHPDDEAKYEAGEMLRDNGNLGAQPVGPACVRRFGLQEWATRHVPAKKG